MFYEVYKDKVYSIAFYYFHGDAAAASDVTQQVFLNAIRSIAKFRGDSGTSTWLYRMTANACVDRSRGPSAREIGTELRQLASRSSIEEDLARTEEGDRVRSAISSLPEKLRLPVLLRYFDDLSYEQLSEVLGCSIGTVASRLNRGHQLLREKLEKLVRR